MSSAILTDIVLERLENESDLFAATLVLASRKKGMTINYESLMRFDGHYFPTKDSAIGALNQLERLGVAEVTTRRIGKADGRPAWTITDFGRQAIRLVYARVGVTTVSVNRKDA